jgi:hypothetical protein
MTLGAMIGLCRDVAMALGLEPVTAIKRTNKGVAFESPEAAFEFLENRVRVIRWERSTSELHEVLRSVLDRLGFAISLEDVQSRAEPSAATGASPPEQSAPGMETPLGSEPEEDEDVMTTMPTDENCEPGF